MQNIDTVLAIQGLGAIIITDLHLPDATATHRGPLFSHLLDTFGTNVNPWCPELPVSLECLKQHDKLHLAASKLQDTDAHILSLQRQMQQLEVTRYTQSVQYLQASVAVNSSNEQNGLPFIARVGLADPQYMERTLLMSRQLDTMQPAPAANSLAMTDEQLNCMAQNAFTQLDIGQHDDA